MSERVGLTFWTFSDKRDVAHFVRHIGTTTPGLTLCGLDRFTEPPRGGAWTPEPKVPVCLVCVDAVEPRKDVPSGPQARSVDPRASGDANPALRDHLMDEHFVPTPLHESLKNIGTPPREKEGGTE